MSPSDSEETFILFRGEKKKGSCLTSYLWRIIPAKDSLSPRRKSLWVPRGSMRKIQCHWPLAQLQLYWGEGVQRDLSLQSCRQLVLTAAPRKVMHRLFFWAHRVIVIGSAGAGPVQSCFSRALKWFSHRAGFENYYPNRSMNLCAPTP